MRSLIALAGLLALGACSTCGSLRAASPSVAPPQAVPLQTSAVLPGRGDPTRLELSGQLYWIERAGPSGVGELRVVDLSDAARPVLARRAIAIAPDGRDARFALTLDLETLPPQARLALEASIRDPQGGLFESPIPLAVERTGGQGLRLRLARTQP